MSKVLITGATGFVGRAITPILLSRGHQVISAVRPGHEMTLAGTTVRLISDIGPETDWGEVLEGIEAVVHLAARVHVMEETATGPAQDTERLYHETNAEGTRRLAEAALAAGVRRIVFLSTIKVNGDATFERPFTEADPASPGDAYARSKWAAEQMLAGIAAASNLETVILRPPLVYGEGVGGNMARLLRLCRSGLPLPLASVENRRSLIYLGNLADAIATALEHRQAAGKTYLIRDGEDLSTPELIRSLGAALGRPARLFPFPPGLLRFLGRISGKSAAVDRLLGSLRVDDGKIRNELGWTPPFGMLQGLERTAVWFNARKE